MERPEKLRKLETFRRRLPHVSASALSEVLDLIDREGVPDLHTRKQIREARNLQCSEITPFGPIIQDMEMVTTSNGIHRIGVAHPLPLLWTALSRSEAFATYFQDRLAAHPSTPETP